MEHVEETPQGTETEEMDGVLRMKNEFMWEAFAFTDGPKRYYALVNIQEGDVLKTPTLEKKGVHLIVPAVNSPEQLNNIF